jgi:hypothetical protein
LWFQARHLALSCSLSASGQTRRLQMRLPQSINGFKIIKRILIGTWKYYVFTANNCDSHCENWLFMNTF